MFQRMFEAVGLTEAEEQAYLALLAEPDASVSAIARSLGTGPKQVRGVLDVLERKGFVSRSPGRAVRYIPVAPDVAVELLALKRQQELEEARVAAAGLKDTFQRALQRTRPWEIVEVVSGVEAIAQRFDQMKRGATTELLVLDRPPYAVAPTEEESTPLVEEKPGFTFRTIFDRRSLEIPGRLAEIEQGSAAGEENRVLEEVPTKLAIADRRIGMLAWNFDHPGVEGALIVHPSTILEALIMLFDLLWERATPVHVADAVGSDVSMLPERTERVLELLASGMKDESVARAMGITRRTVERRVSEMMDALGAKTRFQAGILVNSKGWLAKTGQPEA
jgi:sugar-specific transcriptional regulator TrmB/DNA-binding CsgD family transcriptional regulator